MVDQAVDGTKDILAMNLYVYTVVHFHPFSSTITLSNLFW